MPLSRVAILVALALILGVPFLLRPARTAEVQGVADSLVIVTPHVPQIRSEFERAFSAWHRRVYDRDVAIDWRVPGGTSEILAQLQAVYSSTGRRILAELAEKDPQRMSDPDLTLDTLIPERSLTLDLMFGGGSYDHGRVKNPRTVGIWTSAFPGGGPEPVVLGPMAKDETLEQLLDVSRKEVTLRTQVRGKTLVLRLPMTAISGGRETLRGFGAAETIAATVELGAALREVPLSMSEPAGFAQERMDAWFGENAVGAQQLYDPEQYWIGTALSGFGIVYNKEVLARLGVPAPTRFDDLADPRLYGMVILADPRQSGSVATTLDSILSNYGWERGWGLIREMCGNSRIYTNSAPKPPIDVSQGEAAAGLAIDFYGRGQAQAVLAPGQRPEDSRVGYVDPAGATYIDADPVSILRGGPHPELARHFVEFCLTDEGQALWQFPAKTDPRSAENPVGEGGIVLGPAQYELRRMPVRRAMYERYLGAFIDKANPFEIASKTKTAGWRGMLGVMMGAFAIDNAHLQREAWAALVEARADSSFPGASREEMERLYYAFPPVTLPGTTEAVVVGPGVVKALLDAWKKNPAFQSQCEIDFTRFYRAGYQRMLEIAAAHALD